MAWGDAVVCLPADGQDYNATSQDVTIPAGSNRGCVNFTIINDDIALEGDEQFRVTFTVPDPAQAALVNTTDSSSIVTIRDDDSECSHALSIGPALTMMHPLPQLKLSPTSDRRCTTPLKAQLLKSV